MIFDLHVHTNYSDGLFSPTEVVNLAIIKGIDGIAITDHDTVLGIEAAINYSKRINKIIVIPGIELGCIHNDEEVHLLGYFFDYKSKDIMDVTEQLRINRVIRGIKMVERINDLGMELTLEEVQKLTRKDYIGRPHIAQALVNRGYVNSIEEAFDRLLNRGMPAYIERETLSIVEAIDLIHDLDGIAILAHPGLLRSQETLFYCIEKGIDGLEVIHSKHTKNNIDFLLQICDNSDLIATGGSDCHGRIIDGDYLLGKYYVNINHIPMMRRRI
ncbi:PHP domain-containing protein [Tepidimicrobium xylanilyticum]|uniref:Polymerase/histidinol phosphatase N-terminal domain-containing protein n=1 Tax=Tepidimicrobium xylanilyticum TaxID=1123352 RepID=A0A1H2Y9M3_9FIRM|nr:PHP domain-containing protein [Tepidimicrobium xylanilyticum]GMG97072.1 PHP-like protein [Tepidimicrobium xylanilyticum]SDX01269.1 hypothetical protein SAMN05660923_01553 [Tepidimicrobium xylanilyticum]